MGEGARGREKEGDGRRVGQRRVEGSRDEKESERREGGKGEAIEGREWKGGKTGTCS